MNINIKLLSETAKVPTKAHATDAGFDLYADSIITDNDSIDKITYGTGIALEIPDGFVGLIFPRSSIVNKGLSLRNSVGVIDASYRGEIKAVFTLLSSNVYSIGDRIAQIVFLKLPEVNLNVTSELSNTDRGAGGFGSSGK